MPPRKQKQTATSSSADAPVPSFPLPETATTTRNEFTHTPERTPRKPAIAEITQVQKQALIDNLQLEVTERARKLRAQYALQAQGLRARLEMRVNRIPQALRKRTVQDLIEEHQQKAKLSQVAQTVPAQQSGQRIEEPVDQGTIRAKPKGLKRSSDQMVESTDDKENQPASSQDNLANPKKRAKPGPASALSANTKAMPTNSRVANTKATAQTTVLSPRSANSRTLPRSPFKSIGGANDKSRPTTPAKMAQSRGSTRPISRQQQKHGVLGQPKGQDDSELSNGSVGTTIVSKAGTKGKASTVGRATGAKTAPRKGAAAAKKDNDVPDKAATVSSAGGRSLRKRG